MKKDPPNGNMAVPRSVLKQLRLMATKEGKYMWEMIADKFGIPKPPINRGGVRPGSGRPKGSHLA